MLAEQRLRVLVKAASYRRKLCEGSGESVRKLGEQKLDALGGGRRVGVVEVEEAVGYSIARPCVQSLGVEDSHAARCDEIVEWGLGPEVAEAVVERGADRSPGWVLHVRSKDGCGLDELVPRLAERLDPFPREPLVEEASDWTVTIGEFARERHSRLRHDAGRKTQ